MRSIKIWELGRSPNGEEVSLPESSPDENYICIKDDLNDIVSIPKDQWKDFIEACQKLEVSS